MNRYRISGHQIKKAKKFLKDGKPRGVPGWATKHKDKLSVKAGKLYYDDKLVVPREDVNDYLRKRLYDKNTDLQQSRDSAHYQVMKDAVGVTRRSIMEFLKAQKTLGETRVATAKPKAKSGPKLKKHVLETDLFFITRDDLINANPRFERKHKPNLVYALCTTDKLSGLTKLSLVLKKDADICTPELKKHIQWFAKKFKLKTQDFDLHSDSGGEFNHNALKGLVGETKFVKTGVSVEKKNQQVQEYFYRILKNRQAITVKNALQKAELLTNNCLNRIQKKTPLESCDEKTDDLVKNYNKKRGTYVQGDKRKELQVGDHVRLLVKDPKKHLEYKSYKGKTWSNRVYKITSRTKKKKPVKYAVTHEVNRKYYTIESLLKSAPRDKKSNKIIDERDEKQNEEDEKEMEAERAELKKIRKQLADKYKNAGDKKKLAGVKKLAANREKQEAVDQQLDDLEAEEDKKAGKKIKKPRQKQINAPEVDEDYKPGKKAKPKKQKPKPKYSQKDKTKIIRTYIRLRNKYQRMRKKKNPTDKDYEAQRSVRNDGFKVVKQIRESNMRQNLDLDVFND